MFSYSGINSIRRLVYRGPALSVFESEIMPLELMLRPSRSD
jgi:hypothetical protein